MAVDQAECIVTLWNGQPISVEFAELLVELEIAGYRPRLKLGDTAGTGVSKPATPSTGAVVKVPPPCRLAK